MEPESTLLRLKEPEPVLNIRNL